MQLRNHWIPSFTVYRSFGLIGDEIMFTFINDDYEDDRDDEAPITTNFGLWAINLATGEERTILAPFSLQELYKRSKHCGWYVTARHGDDLVMMLRTKHSYDLRYHFFSFDGATWKQVLYPGPTQRIVFNDQAFKTWAAPGRLELTDHPLVGGEVMSSGSPLTFSADFTHAFSYDSGPMTPSAPEYEETIERRKTHPAEHFPSEAIYEATHPAVVAAGTSKESAPDARPSRFMLIESPQGQVLVEDYYGESLRRVSLLTT